MSPFNTYDSFIKIKLVSLQKHRHSITSFFFFAVLFSASVMVSFIKARFVLRISGVSNSIKLIKLDRNSTSQSGAEFTVARSTGLVALSGGNAIQTSHFCPVESNTYI